MTENQGTHQRWQDGLATRPDVDRLMAAYPALKTGDRMSYADVSELLKLEITATRFKSVTTAWRKRLLNDHGTNVECDRGKGFYVSTAEQIAAMTHPVINSTRRKFKRQRQKLKIAKPETPEMGNILTHHGMLLHAMERDAKKANMNLIPSTIAAVVPQINPPEKKPA